jgi:hypothetical protein
VGAGTPDERERNRVSVSKSICHSEFPESTRARASAQGSLHSESSPLALALTGTTTLAFLTNHAGTGIAKAAAGPLAEHLRDMREEMALP